MDKVTTGSLNIQDVATNENGEIVVYLEESGSMLNIFKSTDYGSNFTLIQSITGSVNDSENIAISKY